MKKICIITGTRAEYGHLKPLISKVNYDEQFELKLIVTGMHLSPEFGMTYKEIESDGFVIDEKLEILMSSDTPVGISKSMGLAMISFAECFARMEPDMIIVLGDRYEIFSAVSAASILRIPIAHLYGGETTEGAIDEAFRHSITKMSYLHFTSTEEYRKRVIQLGEDPLRVFNVGAIGIENIKTLESISKKELEETIGLNLNGRIALVTYHPVTLESNTTEEQFRNLIGALDNIDNLNIIFTKSNSDTDGRIINQMIDEYVNNNREKAVKFTSMGQFLYLNTMKYADVVIGNSSSGIIEAPYYGVPTVNIGDRQKGRIQAKSVLNCRPIMEDITTATLKAFSKDFREKIRYVHNPYGYGNASDEIIIKIKEVLKKRIDIKKQFYDM